MKYGIAIHGGVCSKMELEPNCIEAAKVGERILADGGSALDAAVSTCVVLENDPVFNAGTGASPQLDFECEMDAGLMTSEGEIGAVASIHRVKNPILVARKVMEETNHLILAGSGATRFAREKGFEEYQPLTKARRKRLEKLLEKVKEEGSTDYRKHLELLDSVDTVGAVACDSKGSLAAANSTGGISLATPGRVGDSPIVGAGFYAGPAAAVITTGIGEEIIRRMSARVAYDRLESGQDPQTVCDESFSDFPEVASFGIVIITKETAVYAANRDMPVAVFVNE